MVSNEKTKPENDEVNKINSKKLRQRQFRDKVVFTLNFILLIVAIMAFSKGPVYFAYVNAISVIILMIHRIYEFSCYKWQFYLIDFCYVINVVVIIYSIFYPKNYDLFVCAYAFSMSAVFNAIPYYRQGFAFHNTVKMTSLWTHYSPPLTMFLIRWFDYNNDFLGNDFFNNISFDVSFLSHYFYTCSKLFLTWYFIYYSLVFGLLKGFIKRNNYETQFDYIMKKKESALTRFGRKWAEVIFMTYSLVGVYRWIVLSLIVFFSFYAATAWAIYLTVVAIWWGASYYMNYFSVHYLKQFSEDADKEIYATPI